MRRVDPESTRGGRAPDCGTDSCGFETYHSSTFQELTLEVPPAQEISGARVLAVFNDSIATGD